MGIKTGISSWAERSLLSVGFYPPGTKPNARLSYYASHFSIVENDSAYYAVPSVDQTQSWVRQTHLGFTMNVKAFALLTGHYTEPRRLPEDLRRSLPESVEPTRRIYPKDLGPVVMAEVARRFRQAIEPLHAGGRLGLVLFQYPVWFGRSPEHEAELGRIRRIVPDCQPAVEFRNQTWMSERNRERTLSILRANGLVYTCVDEPQGFASSMPPVIAATGDIALLRFHGRNRAQWNQKSARASDRFAYLYSSAELAEWVPKIRDLAGRVRDVHIILNNCYLDYAVVNARQMRAMLANEIETTANSAAPVNARESAALGRQGAEADRSRI